MLILKKWTPSSVFFIIISRPTTIGIWEIFFWCWTVFTQENPQYRRKLPNFCQISAREMIGRSCLISWVKVGWHAVYSHPGSYAYDECFVNRPMYPIKMFCNVLTWKNRLRNKYKLLVLKPGLISVSLYDTASTPSLLHALPLLIPFPAPLPLLQGGDLLKNWETSVGIEGEALVHFKNTDHIFLIYTSPQLPLILGWYHN